MAGELVIVALSGGVDSAVAALLLKEAGYRVQGLHMTNWEDDGYCNSAAEFQDARQVCETLGVPLHRVNFSHEYRHQVFSQFLLELQHGRTPNPDVLCNREIKFGVLSRYAKRLGGHWLATGHYARVEHAKSGARLLKGLDKDKDQSYFLHAVTSEQLSNVLFPLGHLRKSDVRRRAGQAGLGVAEKKDSTGICFIGERPFTEFLQQHVVSRPGPIKAADGEVLGTHIGLAFYTLGQRHGLDIGGIKDREQTPWYVAAKCIENNSLTVVQGRNHPLLLSNSLHAVRAHWIGARPAELAGGGMRCKAKIRYRQTDQACTVALGADGDELLLEFDEPQRAVTPGQYVVLYDGDY